MLPEKVRRFHQELQALLRMLKRWLKYLKIIFVINIYFSHLVCIILAEVSVCIQILSLIFGYKYPWQNHKTSLHHILTQNRSFFSWINNTYGRLIKSWIGLFDINYEKGLCAFLLSEFRFAESSITKRFQKSITFFNLHFKLELPENIRKLKLDGSK